MNEIARLRSNLLKKIIFFAVPVFSALILFEREVIAASFAFGVVMSWLDVHLLSKDISSIDLSKQNISGALLKSYFLRYFVLFLSLLFVFKFKLNAIGFVIGFFVVRILLLNVNLRMSHEK